MSGPIKNAVMMVPIPGNFPKLAPRATQTKSLNTLIHLNGTMRPFSVILFLARISPDFDTAK